MQGRFLAKQQLLAKRFAGKRLPNEVAVASHTTGPLVSIASLEASTRHGRSGAAFHSIVYYRSFASRS